jgi:hypothetical protein
VKRLEDMLQLVRGDADAGIAQRHSEAAQFRRVE